MNVFSKYTGISYWLGGLILGILNVCLFWISSKPLGVTAVITFWGAGLVSFFGADPSKWLYFSQLELQNQLGEQHLNFGSLLIVGIALGSFIAAVSHREFRIRKARHKKQYILGIFGGILMGYGARLAGGCTVGALVSGTASLSLHGFVFGIFLFIGVWVGLKLVQKILYH